MDGKTFAEAQFPPETEVANNVMMMILISNRDNIDTSNILRY